jgi:nitric oxide reductase large subunit
VKRAIAHLALIAIAAWLLAQMFRITVAPRPLNLALWLALGAVAVDLLLLPLYSGADALIRRLPAPLINHVRFPVAISAVLLLVWFPLILQRQPSGYVNALGRQPPDYLGRGLAVTAGLFVLSALVLAVRRLTASRAGAARPSGR